MEYKGLNFSALYVPTSTDKQIRENIFAGNYHVKFGHFRANIM